MLNNSRHALSRVKIEKSSFANCFETGEVLSAASASISPVKLASRYAVSSLNLQATFLEADANVEQNVHKIIEECKVSEKV